MEYFLCIENTPYYHWQTELLIESFLHHKCQDDLLISIVPSSSAQLNPNLNLGSHKRFVSPNINIGEQRGYNKLNTLYNLLAVVEQEQIKPPFALIESDMVMYEPIKDNDAYNISFQVDPALSPDVVEENCKIQKHLKHLAKKLNIKLNDAWLPVGNVLVFNSAPKELFMRVISVTEKLATEQLQDTGKIWEHTDRVGWAITLLEYYGQMSYEATYNYEMNMLENEWMRNFIHYEHGIPPVFSKHMFRYQEPSYFVFSDEEPIDFLAKHDMAVSAAAHYIQQLASFYVDKKSESKE
jgi:hypothetical protein